jgi:ankyrin repeat protein
MILAPDDPLAVEVTAAIHRGDTEDLAARLRDHAGLATARIGDDSCSRTLLHVLTDWPGHRPNGAATVGVLVDAGADVNARFVGRHTETPLHWAASCDDVDVLDALLDRGADIEADGAVIGGGTPLLDATAFGQWHVARRLVERGAETRLWPAATLGLLDRVEAELVARPPTREEVTEAFWGACHGGQRATAERLLAEGAEINWVGWDDLTPLDAASREGAADVVAWLASIGGVSALG